MDLADYEVIKTQDGSPTLRRFSQDKTVLPETMHHSGGAFSETLEIYGKPLKTAIEQGARQVLSVGLGLGYNEVLAAILSLQKGVKLKVVSHEADQDLVKGFLSFVNAERAPVVYEEMTSHFTKEFKVSSEQIRVKIKKMLENQELLILGALNESSVWSEKFDVILFDAYSSKTSPGLWTEDFLSLLLETGTSKSCIFTTYACTGLLKRTLKKHDFEVIVRDGFHGKRNSTLGIKGYVVVL